MSFDMEGSHQGFPEIPTPKPTKKVTVVKIRDPKIPIPKPTTKVTVVKIRDPKINISIP